MPNSPCNHSQGTYLKEVGVHLGQHCQICNQWLGWMPKDTPYDPKWVIDFGVHKGKMISALPTDYLEHMIVTSSGTRKKWFKQAYVNRHIVFLDTIRKMIDNYLDRLDKEDKMRVSPTVAELKNLFLERYPDSEDRFDKYLITAIDMLMNGELVYNSHTICITNSQVYFKNDNGAEGYGDDEGSGLDE